MVMELPSRVVRQSTYTYENYDAATGSGPARSGKMTKEESLSDLRREQPGQKADQFRLEKMAYRYQSGPPG
jgi:hypothetical protein